MTSLAGKLTTRHGVTLTMCYRVMWFIHLSAQAECERNEQPPTLIVDNLFLHTGAYNDSFDVLVVVVTRLDDLSATEQNVS